MFIQLCMLILVLQSIKCDLYNRSINYAQIVSPISNMNLMIGILYMQSYSYTNVFLIKLMFDNLCYNLYVHQVSIY